VLRETIIWLDEWEKELTATITPIHFLSHQTAEGLRVTLHSTIALTEYLLTTCNFKYVLTAKLNQDCLEVSTFFK
jgi:hypothetical protein